MSDKVDAINKAYRAMFLNEAGGLRPHAKIVLLDMMEVARFFTNRPTPLDPLALAVMEGGREVVRHILRKSGAGSEFMKQLLKGENDE